MGAAQTPFQAASCPLGFLPSKQRLEPDTVGKFMPVYKKTIEVQIFRPSA
jgi:hypothetical protein